ncbi:MAG TPA: M14 family zinc carboxypeptidase [Kofleriaceae bacterium]|nr:M14 family zinc carboxypeptidase [Kofleriaceae bacterium]
MTAAMAARHAAYLASSGPDAVARRAGALAAVEIGRSRQGRPIRAITIGTGGPATLVLGGIHPIEWIGVEVALALAEAAAARPPVDRRVVVVPLINPDGHAAVAADLAAGRRRWRRTNAAGVDLNRNFDVGHRAAPRRRLPHLPHAGEWPRSEPEIAAVAALAERLPVDRAVALHSFGRMILLPWAHRGARAPRWDAVHAHAAAVAAALAARGAGRYRVLHTGRWPLFRPGGLELDWLTARGALAMLVECAGGGLAATRPATWLDPFAWYNPADPATHAAMIAGGLGGFVTGAAG